MVTSGPTSLLGLQYVKDGDQGEQQARYVRLCYVMVPLLPPVNCVGDSWGWRLHATSAQRLL
jgi:hypothetical protein